MVQYNSPQELLFNEYATSTHEKITIESIKKKPYQANKKEMTKTKF